MILDYSITSLTKVAVITLVTMASDSPSSQSEAALLRNIDNNVASLLSQSWKATLCFKGFLCQQNTTQAHHDHHVLQGYDLFELTKRIWKGFIFRFDPTNIMFCQVDLQRIVTPTSVS
jgi:hypothetical protein